MRREMNEDFKWRGPEDGLPPIGTTCICEYYRHGHITKKATIVAYDGKNRVWVDSDCGESYILVISETDFKPVPTEKDFFVQDVTKIIKECVSAENAAEELYQLGFRKQESK